MYPEGRRDVLDELLVREQDMKRRLMGGGRWWGVPPPPTIKCLRDILCSQLTSRVSRTYDLEHLAKVSAA